MSEDEGEGEDEDMIFEDKDNLLDENFRDGNVYNYSGNKPQ